jgi:hypothetical protein
MLFFGVATRFATVLSRVMCALFSSLVFISVSFLVSALLDPDMVWVVQCFCPKQIAISE